MAVGRLRYRVELQKPLYADGEGGKQIINWQRVKDLFVSMDGVGTEQLTGDQTQARNLWTMVAHADSDITPERRFVMNGRVFDIITVVPATGNVDLFVDITASETIQ